MRIYALKKLKDDKKIKWREAYTDKSLFLKDQFEYAIGPKSYYRFEGKQVDGPGEWYVVIGPSGAYDVEPKWFAGIRKLPDSWPAGGKKFDNIVDAFNYAFDTWGVPKPKSLPRYTASDLRNIDSKIEEFKKMREQEGEKPVEKEKSSASTVFINKEGMAGGNIMRASLVWHAGEFEEFFADGSEIDYSFNNLLRAGGFSSLQEAEAELERLKNAAGDAPVGSREHMPITMMEDALKVRDEASGTFVPWAQENAWLRVAMDEVEFEDTANIGAAPRVPELANLIIRFPDINQENSVPVAGNPPLVVLEYITQVVREAGPDISEAELEMTFSGREDDPALVDIYFEAGEQLSRSTIIKKIREFAEDRSISNWVSSAWRELAPRRRMRIAALLAVAGRQERLASLPFDEEQLARQPEESQQLVRRSPFEEGIEGSVNELRRLRNQFTNTHTELAEQLEQTSSSEGRSVSDNIPAHTYVEYSPRDGSQRILYLALYSGGQSFGQNYYIDNQRLEDESFFGAFRRAFRPAETADEIARRAADYLRSEDTTFTVERTGWGNPVEARAFGNNMNRMQINEVISNMSSAIGRDVTNQLMNDLRRVFAGGIVTLALNGGEDGGPLSVPVRNGGEKSLLYDALGGFWPGSYRLMDGLDKDRFPRGLVDKKSRDMLDEIVISSSPRRVNSETLVERVNTMAANGDMSPQSVQQIVEVLGRRNTWTALQFHDAFPGLSSFDVINLFGSADPSDTLIDMGTLKRFLSDVKLTQHMRLMLGPNKASAKLPDGSYPPGYKKHFLTALQQEFGDTFSTADLSLFLARYVGQEGARFSGSEISSIINGCLDKQGSRLESVTSFIGSDFMVSTQPTARRTIRTPIMNLTGSGYIRLFRGLMNGIWNIRSDFPDLYERILRSQMLPIEAARDPEIAREWNEALQIEDQNERLNVLDAIIDRVLEENAGLEPYDFFGAANQVRDPMFQDNVLLRSRLSDRRSPSMVQGQYDQLQGKIMGEVAKSLVLGEGTVPGVAEDAPQLENLKSRLSTINLAVPRFSTAQVPPYLRRVGEVDEEGNPTYDAEFDSEGDDVVLLNRMDTPRIQLSDIQGRRILMYNLATENPGPGENRPYNINPRAIFEIADWSQIPLSRVDTFGTHTGSGNPTKSAPRRWTQPLIDVFEEFYDSVGMPCPYRPVSFKMTNSAVSASARSNYMLHSSRQGRSVDHPVVDEMVTGAKNFGEHIRMGLNGFYPLGDLPYRQTIERLGPEAAELTGEQLARQLSYRTPMNRELRNFLGRVTNMQAAMRSFSDDVDGQLVNAMLYDRRQREGVLMLGEPARPWYEFAFAEPEQISRRVRQIRPRINSVVAAVTGYVQNIQSPFVRATALRQAIPYDVLSDEAYMELFDLPAPNSADAAESIRKGHIMRQIQHGSEGNDIFALFDPEAEVAPVQTTEEWGSVVNAVGDVAQVMDTVVDQHDAAEEEAELETEEETGNVIDEDADPEEDGATEVVEVTEDTPLDGAPPDADEEELSIEEMMRRQQEELENVLDETGRQAPEPEPEPEAPDADEEELSVEEMMRRQQEELERLIHEQEQSQQPEQQEEEQTENGGNDRGASALLGLLKTARDMSRMGLHSIAGNINTLVSDEIRSGAVSRRRVLLRTSRSLSEASRQLAREGKNTEAEEINRLASSYRKKYETESGE